MDNFDLSRIMSEENEYADGERSLLSKSDVSPAVIKRLPRYFRYLRELIRSGKTRISSGELSEIMHVTASQIRQDLNCFGGFGQQGYGYNVNYLYANICDILGVGMGFRGIIIGAGNLGTALIKNPMFEKRGVDIIAMFDVDPGIVGKVIAGIEVYDMKDLEKFCKSNRVDIAVLTLPKELAQAAAEQAVRLGIRGLWNFTGKEFYFEKGVVVKNVHLGDSLMTLCYELCHINQRTGEPSDED